MPTLAYFTPTIAQRDASAGPSASDGKTAVFPFEKVVTLQNTAKLELVSRNYSTEFATDSSIKKHGDMSHLEGRNLKSVDNSWLQPGNDMSLEGKSGSGKSWDQFETNRRLFNVKDTYDENLYTKKLDLKSMTSEQIAMADRLAREIEGTASSNIHLQEERGQAPEGDWDEEDRFSGVLKEAPAVKKAAPEVNNPWKRGAKLTGAAVVAGTASAGASGAASPATPATLSNSASATSISGKAPLTPPPGVTKKPATATNTAVPAEAAPKKIEEEKGSDKANKAEKTDKPAEKTSDKTEKVEKKAEPVTEATTAPVAAADKADKPVDAATPEAKPAPVKKLNAAAAEFKPAWMTAAAPAPAVVAPATPVAPSTPQQSGFVPQQQFTPSHNHYNSPDVYNKAPHTPNYVPHGPAEGYGGFDPNVAPMGMLPPQYIPGTPPMMYDPNAPSYFMPPQMQPMVMDYVPNMNGIMPMPMMPVQGMQGMPMQGMPGMPYPPMQQQGMPMHDGGMYMPQNMGFQPNMNMNMGMMQQQQQPNHQMGGMYSPQQGYNNNGMGSGQKSKFNNNNNNGNGDIR